MRGQGFVSIREQQLMPIFSPDMYTDERDERRSYEDSPVHSGRHSRSVRADAGPGLSVPDPRLLEDEGVNCGTPPPICSICYREVKTTLLPPIGAMCCIYDCGMPATQRALLTNGEVESRCDTHTFDGKHNAQDSRHSS